MSKLIILFIVFGIVSILIYRIMKQSYLLVSGIINVSTQYRLKHYWHRNVLHRKLKPQYKEILRRYFRYYNQLSAENKALFEKRLQYFIDMKEFIPRSKSLELTDEMVVLISACAIQLTFGYPGVYFSHFKRILIYPDDYYSQITRKYHKGEVNRAGIIVLSWKNFLNGYADRSDGRNLGLHEMAHALFLEDRIMNDEFEFLERDHLKEWERMAEKEMDRIRQGTSIFREYGATDIHEFFAVAVEVYFELPQQLYDYDTEVYRSMANLLNQDVLFGLR